MPQFYEISPTAKEEVSTIPDGHIAFLSKYALHAERIFLLIRFKTGNDTKHKLWQETVDGLEWQMEQRGASKNVKVKDQDVRFLTDTGKPV